MSLGEYLRMGLKNRVTRCGTAIEPFSFAQRTESIIQRRRESRHSLILKRRNITENTLSPIVSPLKSIKKAMRPPAVEKHQSQSEKRMEMLKQWQVEKKKRLEELKAKKKAVFKVCKVAETVGYNNIDKALKEIKGKPINTKLKDRNSNVAHKVAPSDTHQFKPPANIKPIYFNNTSKVKLNKEVAPQKVVRSVKEVATIARNLKFEPEIKTRRGTKVNTVSVGKNTMSKSKDHFKGTTKQDTSEGVPTRRATKTRPSAQIEVQPQIETVLPLPNPGTLLANSPRTVLTEVTNFSINTESDKTVTPTSPTGSTSSSIYISPYVTVSRGKLNARKEYEKKVKGEKCDNGNSPTTSAMHFTQMVTAETNRLNTLCEKWTNYKEAEQPGEEACDMINVAIGQTELLLNKKFKQFRNLIECCLTGDSEKPVTSFDLQGFWDTTMLQVKNLDKRFEYLETLKLNNWEEILPTVKPKTKPREALRKPTAKASSSLMAAIKEARKKKQEFSNENAIVSISTPSQGQRRKSLRNNVIASSKCKTCSPDVMVLKGTPLIKCCGSPHAHNSIPKSILKSSQKSEKRRNFQAKAVLFTNVDYEDEKENRVETLQFTNPNSPKSSNFLTPRRSARLFAKTNV